MANNCAVASRIYENDLNTFFAPPICDVNKHNLYNTLKRLIQDRDYRLSLARLGRDYVSRLNAPAVVAGNILDGLEKQSKPVFHPTFFCENFDLELHGTLTDEVKKLNRNAISRFQPLYAEAPHLENLSRRGLI